VVGWCPPTKSCGWELRDCFRRLSSVRGQCLDRRHKNYGLEYVLANDLMIRYDGPFLVCCSLMSLSCFSTLVRRSRSCLSAVSVRSSLNCRGGIDEGGATVPVGSLTKVNCCSSASVSTRGSAYFKRVLNRMGLRTRPSKTLAERSTP
jgi:hypothetical protein